MVTIPLWEAGKVPGALGNEPHDTPDLTVYPADPNQNNGAALIVLPGGGYHILADHEGEPLAKWANENGATGFVLKYRLGSNGYRHPSMLDDALRAIKTVRARAGEWGINPNKIGILGFSAGGHLASTAITHFDSGDSDNSDPIEKASSRPDYAVLIYPVISLEPPMSHAGSGENLLGKNPDAALLHHLSNQHHVTAQTPPTYLVHSADDKAVPVENSLHFALQLAANKVPFGMAIFAHGGHGYGMADGIKTGNYQAADDPQIAKWQDLCADWLRQQGFWE